MAGPPAGLGKVWNTMVWTGKHLQEVNVHLKPFSTRFFHALLLAMLAGLSVVALVSAQTTLTLLVYEVTAQPIPDSESYDVSIRFSLIDSGGNPIKDIRADHFRILEDDQPVIVSAVESVQAPIHVVLALDTSGSMLGEKMQAARMAATRFVNMLQSRDRVAVLTFDRSVTHRIDFTTDHLAVEQQIQLIDYTPGGATCLYDAAYEAVRMATSLTEGQRAVILLTDGRDELGGKPCSASTLEEVVALTTQAKTPTPIYTIGLGKDVDSQALEEIARRSKGRYLFSPTPSQLEALFGRLSDELRSQYVVRYVSSAPMGTHTLTIRVDYLGARDEVSATVDLPPLPYRLTFASPPEGATLSGPTLLVVTVSGQGSPIQRLLFLADGKAIGSDTQPPYELEWDPGERAAGPITLEVIAQDASGSELARRGITVSYAPPPPLGPTQPSPADSQFSGQTLVPWLIAIPLCGVALIAGVMAVVVVRRRRRQKQSIERAWREQIQTAPTPASPAAAMEDRTLDAFTPSENALGILVVLQSDDPTMVGQRIEINKPTTTLGRKADNDIIFARDTPVSRRHAVIEERSGRLFLSEVLAMDESGRPHRPTYGTFVNSQPVKEPVMLRDGDEIRLGKRLRLRFEAVRPAPGGEERTLDQISTEDDHTRDQW